MLDALGNVSFTLSSRESSRRAAVVRDMKSPLTEVYILKRWEERERELRFSMSFHNTRLTSPQKVLAWREKYPPLIQPFAWHLCLRTMNREMEKFSRTGVDKQVVKWRLILNRNISICMHIFMHKCFRCVFIH